jgi:hypothetical protein
MIGCVAFARCVVIALLPQFACEEGALPHFTIHTHHNVKEHGKQYFLQGLDRVQGLSTAIRQCLSWEGMRDEKSTGIYERDIYMLRILPFKGYEKSGKVLQPAELTA